VASAVLLFAAAAVAELLFADSLNGLLVATFAVDILLSAVESVAVCGAMLAVPSSAVADPFRRTRLGRGRGGAGAILSSAVAGLIVAAAVLLFAAAAIAELLFADSLIGLLVATFAFDILLSAIESVTVCGAMLAVLIPLLAVSSFAALSFDPGGWLLTEGPSILS
jgi:hypothetical protein